MTENSVAEGPAAPDSGSEPPVQDQRAPVPDDPAEPSGGQLVPAPAPSAPAAVPSARSEPRDLAEPSELPTDYYVALQPLTLDFVGQQLERIPLKYTRQQDIIITDWKEFSIEIRLVAESFLTFRAVFRQGLPVASTTALTGRCNWWNSTKLFVKASTTVVTARSSSDGDESRPVPVTRVQADFEVPLSAGIAPVQLQALIRYFIGNVSDFAEAANLGRFGLSADWA